MGAYRGHSPNFLDVVRRLFRGGPPNKCQGAKIYPRTKRGDTVNYQLARSRLLGHTSVLTARFWCFLGLKFIAPPLILILVGCDEARRELGKSYDLLQMTVKVADERR